jgi:hypothetical protein
MKSFEELSRPPEHPGNPPSVPAWNICLALPATHPFCSDHFPGLGTPNPPPMSPVPEPGTWITLVVGLVAIAVYRAWRSSPGKA